MPLKGMSAVVNAWPSRSDMRSRRSSLPAPGSAGSDPAGNSFDHSQSRQHANDAGIVPAAVALRRHAAPVQFAGYCPAGNDTTRLQFAKRRREGHRNCAPFFTTDLDGRRIDPMALQ
jgi:hypothetical protein